jgi:signal transduction histidine kinase
MVTALQPALIRLSPCGPSSRSLDRNPQSSIIDGWRRHYHALVMDVPMTHPDRLHRLDGLDRVLGITVVLLLGTLVIPLILGGQLRIVAPGLDLIVDTITTMVTLAVAALAWARFRDRGQRAALFQASAFSVLALARAVAALLALQSLDAATGAATVPLSEDALWLSTLARVVAAGLLVAGGAASLRSGGAGRPAVIMGGPLLFIIAAALLGSLWAPVLPPLVSVIPPTAGSTPAPLPSATPANVVIQSIGAALYLWAAALSRRRHRRDGGLADRYLAVGLLVAAFAQVHLALFPSAYAGVMTSGDLLYLAFDVILLVGIEAETRAYLASLRQANLGLERLKDAEVSRAAIEERARLSRELHDGLAQDLWLAKLKVGRLAALPDLHGEAQVLCEELDDAIDAGLADARQAVMALRVVGGPEVSFRELMRRYVDEFGDRFGLRAEFACDDDLPRLATRTEAELLRIAQEALNNVRRHADAAVVWVQVGMDDHRVVMTVRDNGRGFDPAAVGETGFGLTSMKERAALIGGELTIVSRPSDGTCVTVDVPLPRNGSVPVGAGQ